MDDPAKVARDLLERVSKNNDTPLKRKSGEVFELVPKKQDPYRQHQPENSLPADYSRKGKIMTFKSIVWAIVAILGVIGTIYGVTNDLQANKTAVQTLSIQRDMSEIALKSKMQDTKQMEIALKSGAAVNMPRSFQDYSFAEGYLVPVGEQRIFSRGALRFPDTGDQLAAVLILGNAPTKMSGAFKLVRRDDPSQVAWSPGWSQEASPVSLEKFLRDAVNSEGGSKQVEVYSRGESSLGI